MIRRRKIFFIALAVFIASFLITAVQISFLGFNVPGYVCALGTLVSPWQKSNLVDLSSKPVEYFSVLLSGIINPLFVTAIALLQTARGYQAGKQLRKIVIGLFPVCWIYFWHAGLYPHVGYFLWTAAMLVALFAASPKTQTDPVQPNNLEPERPREASTSTTFLLLKAAKSISAS